MPKTMQSHRFSELTISRIADLIEWLPAESGTHAIEEAVSIIHTQLKNERELKMSKISVGDKVQFEHPNGKGEEQAEVTALTADKRGNIYGAMIKFKDGTYIEVASGYLHAAS